MERAAIAVVLVILSSLAQGQTTYHPHTTDDFENSRVALVVSPLISHSLIRELQIYWNHPSYRTGDVIAVYTGDPSNRTNVPIYALDPGTPNGTKNTGFEADFVPTSKLTFVRQCLKYHVAWLRDGIVRRQNCLETHPNWMAERREILGPRIMSRVFLPGTHDSASYAMYESAENKSIFEMYVITQDVDVLAQLIYGVRYLDIRVGHYPQTNEIWWANHGIINLIPLQTIIDQVNIFLRNTEEIVIFDIQEFPVGFNDNLTIHHEFVNYLEEQFADVYVSNTYGWSSTLRTIWSSGKKLIIGYDEEQVFNDHVSVWPCVKHQWGNVRTIEDLYRYLKKIEIPNYRIIPRAAMAELTPNAWDVIFDRLGGLRQMAYDVNINITNWYGTMWQRTANIVAVDFVRGTGIIETAIEWNEKRNSTGHNPQTVQNSSSIHRVQ